jgi:hypothetical protein
MLSSGVRPGGAEPPGATGSASSPAGMFADLLKQAQEGTLTTKLPVTIAPDCGVTLSDDELARLSFAADKLEASGVKTALVTIDGQRLLLDVHSRKITGRADGHDGIVAGIDGTLDLGDARTDAGAPDSGAGAQTVLGGAQQLPGGATRALKIPAGGGLVGNPSVAKLLAELGLARKAG